MSQQQSGGKKSGIDAFIAGLQFWVVFLVGLVILGYPLAIAIVFGAIAGLAGSFIVGWWQTPVIVKEKVVIINDADVLNAATPDDLYEGYKQKREQRYSQGRQRRDRAPSGQRRLNWVPWRRSRE